MEEAPLVIDNGSYEIKFGLATEENNLTNNFTPYRALNCLSRDKFNTTYISNQIKRIKDVSGVTIRRPHVLGQLVSWELESCIWDYCLYNPREFNGFDVGDTVGKHLVVSDTCMGLPELSKNMDQVIFEEYEFASLYRGCTAGFVPFNNINDDDNTQVLSENESVMSRGDVQTRTGSEYRDFQLVIDSGFDCTWIVPIIKGIPVYKAIKRLDIGGRFLTGLLKETLSFRHYNVMDETILVNNIKETCLFVSPTSYQDSFARRETTAVEYVLPDFQTSTLGYVLQKRGNQERASGNTNTQTITLKDELFAIPETFFHPEIANILKPGIIETILECLSMLPEAVQPLMVSNMVCIGGNFNLPNFSQRLVSELQRQLPTDWTCRLISPKTAAELYGWRSMNAFAMTESYRTARVNRAEYLEHGPEWCTKHRFGYQNWI